MKKLLTSLVAVTLAVAVGCESKSPPGGPGAQKTDSGTTKTARGQSAETFKMLKPSTVDLKQGEAKEVDVKIDRGTTFNEPVTISFDSLPEGVTMEPASAKIESGHDKAIFKVKTTNNTPVGDKTIKVVATPKTGEATQEELKIKVEKGGTAK
jgi:hypothetical protein